MDEEHCQLEVLLSSSRACLVASVHYLHILGEVFEVSKRGREAPSPGMDVASRRRETIHAMILRHPKYSHRSADSNILESPALCKMMYPSNDI